MISSNLTGVADDNRSLRVYRSYNSPRNPKGDHDEKTETGPLNMASKRRLTEFGCLVPEGGVATCTEANFRRSGSEAMNTMSRRMACKVCRERKVRCDGEPECGNCRRSGDPCVYLPTNKSTKADISQSLEAIQDRLERVEAFIDIQAQASRRNAALSRPYSEHHAELQGVDHSVFYFPAPTQVTAGSLGPKHRNTAFPRYQSPEYAEGDLFSNLPTPRTASRNDMYQFQMYDLMSGQPNETVPPVFSDPDRATASPILSPSPAPALLSPSSPSGDMTDDRGRVLGELKSFSAQVLITQAQIAAVATATADLMAWLRQAPLVSSGSVTNTTYGGQMVRETLATLDKRVQELAETGHSEAWKRLKSGLEGTEPADVELRAHEGELQSQLAAISDFFKNEYNVSSPLHEQKRRTQPPPLMNRLNR
ncbi:hypothetical protein LZ30DRAFT_768621 [Colletotrichum cereale]|nr:hypothetical protein LZ30DRAFT_768621 [Colletotrichum cereale]